MTDDDDYERLEDCIDDFEDDIYARYGDVYSKLDDEKKEKVILDVWFEGTHAQQGNMTFNNVGYEESARQLRIGLDYYQGHKTAMKNVTVKTFFRRGIEYTYVMQNGKFKSRVK